MNVQELNVGILLSASENSIRWSSVPWIGVCWRSSCTAFSEWKRESESLNPLVVCEHEKLASPFPQESYQTERIYHNLQVILPVRCNTWLNTRKCRKKNAKYSFQKRGWLTVDVGKRKSKSTLFMQDWEAIKHNYAQ